MPDRTQRPDAEYITKLKTRLEQKWQSTHRHWEQEIDPWVLGSANIWPERFKHRSSYIPSTARSIIDIAADVQLSFEPHIHRNPVVPGKDAEIDSDGVEAGLFHVMMDSQLQEPELPFKALGKYLAKYGYAILDGPHLDYTERPEKPVRDDYDSDEEFGWADTDFENAMRYWNPVRFHAPHPSTILLDPDRKRPYEGIKVVWFLRDDLIDILDAAREREENPPVDIADNEFLTQKAGENDEIMVVEYYSAHWHVLLWENDVLLLEKNARGFCPYTQVFAGFGSIPTSAVEQNASRQANRKDTPQRYLAEGLLDAVLPDLKVEAQAESAKHNLLVNYSYPRIGTSGDAETAAEQMSDEQQVLEGEKDEWWVLQQPELQRWVLQVGDSAKQNIRQGTYPSDVGGVRQVGVSTVGQQAALLINAAKRFAVVSKQLDHIATILGSNILKLVDRMDEELMVGGHKLGRSNIKHDYFCIAEFRTIDPLLQQVSRELGLREIEAGVKSTQTYLESDLQVANVSLEMDRKLRERIRETLPYAEIMAEQIAEEDGMAEALARHRQNDAGANATPNAPSPTSLSPLAGGTNNDAVLGFPDAAAGRG